MNNTLRQVQTRPFDLETKISALLEKYESNQRANDVSVSQLQEQIIALQQQVQILQTACGVPVREITDSVARDEVVALIRELKEKGRSSASELEISEKLNLPIEQVSAILEALRV